MVSFPRPQLAIAGLVAALTGCAPWIDDQNVWFDAPEDFDGPSVGVEFGYDAEGDARAEPGPPPSSDVEPANAGSQGHGRSASFGARHMGPVCTLTSPKVHVRPHIDHEDIRRTVQRHENDVRVCYNRALRRAPELAGRVTLTFVIAADGTVAHAETASDQLEDPTMHQCLVHLATRWSFPVPPGTSPAIVHYPYVFSAS